MQKIPEDECTLGIDLRENTYTWFLNFLCQLQKT